MSKISSFNINLSKNFSLYNKTVERIILMQEEKKNYKKVTVSH